MGRRDQFTGLAGGKFALGLSVSAWATAIFPVPCPRRIWYRNAAISAAGSCWVPPAAAIIRCYHVKVMHLSPVFGVQNIPAEFAKTGGVVFWQEWYNPTPPELGSPVLVLPNADGDDVSASVRRICTTGLPRHANPGWALPTSTRFGGRCPPHISNPAPETRHG